MIPATDVEPLEGETEVIVGYGVTNVYELVAEP